MPREVVSLVRKILKVNIELLLIGILVLFVFKQRVSAEMLLVGNIIASLNLILNTVAFPKIFKEDDQESEAAKKTKLRYVHKYIS